jgi:hypothetical protein
VDLPAIEIEMSVGLSEWMRSFRYRRILRRAAPYVWGPGHNLAVFAQLCSCNRLSARAPLGLPEDHALTCIAAK